MIIINDSFVLFGDVEGLVVVVVIGVFDLDPDDIFCFLTNIEFTNGAINAAIDDCCKLGFVIGPLINIDDDEIGFDLESRIPFVFKSNSC
ncbi:hypothetical protein DERP_010689 [Dermatophagoides pteronyssinus]|uniref:Uncharacterized protein n=1 Tax=Dermatophagoides pteronyssinus TaxID=6956 RepID=A0ABQ8JA47_DERPT|nr:hypothetical protein DERP_010689 [Dermatophagoides pteronyssinus]